MAGGGPVTRRERAVAVPYGRLAVTLALMLGSERNRGWRAARRGHADDAAAWFVSIGRLWRARPPWASAGLGTIAWSLLLLGQLRGDLTPTLTLCAVLGVGAALLAIPAQTTIQEDTPEAMRGKVFGLQNNLINIALSLPLVLAGTVVSRYGLLPVLWALAALAMVAALLERPWERC